MANAKSKAKQVNPVAVAVAACFATVYPALLDAAAQSAENATRGTSRSKMVVVGISALRAALPDAETFQKAAVELFGNGLKKKDERVAGSLADKLKADGVTALTAKSLLHHGRVVCVNWDNPAVQEAAICTGIRAAYDATKAPKPDAEAPKKETAAKPVTLPELIAEMARSLGGLATMAKMMESACIANKDPIRAAVCHEYAVKLTAAS
jgi:hypothetical protein